MVDLVLLDHQLSSLDFSANSTRDGIDILDHFHPALATYHHVLIIVPVYFAFVKIWGPKVMSKRKPFQLKEIITLYNLCQIVLNTHFLYQYSKLMGLQGLQIWSNVCHPVTSANPGNPLFEKKMLDSMYFYYVLKILDLMDTIFFTLRKKQSQVTFLHLFHHTTMVCSVWVSIVYVREEISAVFAGINALTHFVMYTYYLLASLGPQMQKYLWWKKYLTTMQIIQFFCDLGCLAKMKWDGCQANPLFWAMWAFNISVFLGLFVHFYVKSYIRRSKTA